MRKNERKSRIEGLLPLVLLSVFAVCVLAVLLTGADAYKALKARAQDGYDGRTAAQYLSTRFRQADAAGAVDVESFGGADALVLSEEIDGARYETRIYCCDGYIRELFAAADSDLTPQDGEKVLPLAALELDWQDGCLQAELTDADGTVRQLLLCLRSGEEAGA